MAEKFPSWSRSRVGRNRVHWVAYDDRAGAEGRQVVDQGYSSSLPEADAAARSALAAAGLYGGRRVATAFGAATRNARPEARPRARPADVVGLRPRQYLYTRCHPNQDDESHIRAHLVLRKTPKKVYATLRSCWTGQLGTEDESWDNSDPVIALDRARLERDGSAYSTRFRESAFHSAADAAVGDEPSTDQAALARLGLRTPCTFEDIKAAYRRRALEVHPDRGGLAGEFQAVEDAYRQLSRAAEMSLDAQK